MSSGKQEAAGGLEPPVILITRIRSILHQPRNDGLMEERHFQALIRYEK